MSSDKQPSQASSENKEYSTEEMMQEIQRLAGLLLKEDITEEEYLKEKQKLLHMLK